MGENNKKIAFELPFSIVDSCQFTATYSQLHKVRIL